MRVLRAIKFFILIIFLSNLFSCTQDPFINQEPQIRFVDLQGNPRKIKLNTPTENAIALTKQGKITEEKLAEEKNYEQQQNEKEKNLSRNKYSNNQNQDSSDPKAMQKNNALIYTIDMPTEKNNQQNATKPKEETPPATTEKEFEITKKKSPIRNSRNYSQDNIRIISETKIPANSSSKPATKLKKGTYVQAGSFNTMSHAQQHLNKIKSLTNNPRNVSIQTAKVKNKNYYRVVIGPITQKQTANLIIKDLKQKGQNSIIIKVR